MLDRRSFLLSALGAAACSRTDAAAPLRKTAQFLWSQQAEDGGFHSETYGLLRSGQSLTPFLLEVLLDVPDEVLPAPAGAVDRAIAFIRRNTRTDGSVGLMDPTAEDYPNYATALAVSALVKSGRPNLRGAIDSMAVQLAEQQFGEKHGWKRDDPPFGGWGMGGPIHTPPEAGHVDLSMTRMVLEALRAAGIGASDPIMQRALVYLERSRNPDGGFYFSPVNLEINKAGEANGRGHSYGTATADGVLALRAAGIPDLDARVSSAVKWLRDHHQTDRAPGLDVPPYLGWGLGLRFYYGAAIVRAVPGLPVQLPSQNTDGSWANANNLVKEDDPLIASGFALRVLLESESAA